MAVSHGFDVIVGVGSEGTYGNPVAASEKVCVNDVSLREMVKEVMDNSLCGHAARGVGQPGTYEIGGSLSYPLREDLAQQLLLYFFGSIETDTPDEGVNTYVLADTIDGLGLTIAVDKQISVYEFAGYKTSQLTLSGTPGDGITVSLDGFAKSLNLDSVLNTTATLEALAEGGMIYLFQDATFMIRDLADTLDSGDAVAISSFELSVNRNLSPIEVNSHYRTEAFENDFRESTLKFKIPQYQSDYFIDAHRNHTPLQAKIVIDNGTHTKSILMPYMIVTEYSNPVSGAEFLAVDVTCQLIPDTTTENAYMTLFNVGAELEIQED